MISFRLANSVVCFSHGGNMFSRLVSRLRSGDTPKNPDFSIDASHELALYIWEEGKGPELTHLDGFCAKTGPHCALKPQMFAPCVCIKINPH